MTPPGSQGLELRGPLTRAWITDLLERWRTGTIQADDVRDEAERLWDSQDWPDLPRSDAGSIAVEALSQLSILHLQRVTRNDIPAFIEFLGTPAGEEEHGWRRFYDHMDAIAHRA